MMQETELKVNYKRAMERFCAQKFETPVRLQTDKEAAEFRMGAVWQPLL
jgi:hypothetical protein